MMTVMILLPPSPMGPPSKDSFTVSTPIQYENAERCQKAMDRMQGYIVEHLPPFARIEFEGGCEQYLQI